MDYQGDDGYCGLLVLDLASVSCEAAGYRNNSYSVTATREYPHLSANDLSLIPKAITDNGRTLELDSVAWEVQSYTNVDYEDIPDSYRAIAVYTAKASRSVATVYVTTADYKGDVSRTVYGDTVCTVYFSGNEIAPAPKATEPPPAIAPTTAELITPPPTPRMQNNGFPTTLISIALAAVIAILAGAGAYWFLMRHNVKVYYFSDGCRILAAKEKVSVKKPLVDLSPLDGDCFIIEIDKSAAKALNGHTIEIRNGLSFMKHKVAFEGNAYNIEADFSTEIIQAIY